MMRAGVPPGTFRSGYIAIIGRPNVGKSTLLNRLLSEKVSIVSPKPQTTRNRILGILHLPNAQMVFFDTPGLHHAKGKFNRFMVQEALQACREADARLLMIEADGTGKEDNHFILEAIREFQGPTILLINKIDAVKKSLLLPLIDEYRGLFPFSEIIPISALLGDGIDRLLEVLLALLPEGPPYFSNDQITDRTERFLAAEVIREKVFHLYGEEIPYSVAVVVNEFKEREKGVYIQATVYTERESQKGILIGKGGGMLKRIGVLAREDLEHFLGRRVYLDLWVKVQKNWTKDDGALQQFGYRMKT